MSGDIMDRLLAAAEKGDKLAEDARQEIAALNSRLSRAHHALDAIENGRIFFSVYGGYKTYATVGDLINDQDEPIGALRIARLAFLRDFWVAYDRPRKALAWDRKTEDEARAIAAKWEKEAAS